MWPLSEQLSDELITTILDRLSRDPKDKAFGVCFILQESIKRQLPSPNYSLSTGDIYKELCIHLAEGTGSLNFLLPASLNSYPGQPSWVPDWSKRCPLGWWGRDDSKKCAWKWSAENSNALTVEVQQFGRMDFCSRVQTTKDQYTESEKSTHFQNLEIMVHIVNSLTRNWALPWVF